MRIGFMGGSFSPPHLGHLNAAKVFYEEAELDKLIIIPAKVSPFKVNIKAEADDMQRFEMSRLCFSALLENYGYNVEVSSLEIDREGVSYTYLTVRELKTAYPDAELIMYVGSDMFLSLEKWKNACELFNECTVYTRCRESDEMLLLLEAEKRYKSNFGARVIISHDKEVIVSSTLIRQNILAKNFANCEKLLTEKVLRYIIKNRLYTGEI